LPGGTVSDRDVRTAPQAIGHTPPVTDAPRSSAAALSGGPRFALAILVAVAAGVGAGCGNTTPTVGSTPYVASFPPAVRSAGPSVAPSANTAVAAVDAFVALVTKDGFDYQATFTGQDRHTTDIFPVSRGLLQVSGDDVRLLATLTIHGKRYAFEHRWVKGKAWIRYDTDDKWHRVTWSAADTMGAFASIHGRPDVSYNGPVKSDGKTYYQVSFRSAIVNPAILPFSNISDTALKSPTMTVLIDAAGKPVKGTAEIDGRGRISGQLQEIVIDLTVTFTKVGQAVAIKAP
jgi:hypothetical protein